VVSQNTNPTTPPKASSAVPINPASQTPIHGQLAEIEDGRTVPESNTARIKAILQQQKADPAFEVPDDFKELLSEVQTSPTGSPDPTSIPPGL
jgi:hypothetical protein